MNVFNKWILKVFLCIAALLAVLGLFNIWMDPFWCFSHAHRFNSHQGAIDEVELPFLEEAGLQCRDPGRKPRRADQPE